MRVFMAAALAALVLPALPTVASSQNQTVALAAGWTMPKGALADTLKPGFNVVGSINFHFLEHRAALRFDGLYAQMEHKTQARQQQLVAASGNAELSPMGDVSGPYLVVGYGSFRTLKQGTVPASAWEYGYNGGVGARIALLRLALFAEARYYRSTGTVGASYMPISIGIRL